MTELVLIANAKDGSISALRLHRADDASRLEPLTTTSGVPGCGTFAVDAERDLVYAAYKGEPAGIATLRLNRETGELTEVSRRDVDSSLAYLALAAGGSVLLGGSYGGNFGATWRVGDEGVVGDEVSRIEYQHVHCSIAAPAAPSGAGHGVGEVAYFVALGDDLVAQYALAADGTLTPLDPPTVAAPSGCGPRHLIVDGANAYLVTEYSGELIRLTRDEQGRLEPAEALVVVDPRHGLQHSRLDADPEKEHVIWGADVHRAGRWIVTSERSASELTTVVTQEDGQLSETLDYVPTLQQPRGFGVTHDGAYLVAVGEKATEAELFAVDEGRLESLGKTPIGNGANWVSILV